MTIKEAILKCLDDIQTDATYSDVYKHMIKKGYYEFSKKAKTPEATISAQLGDFIRHGDSRVKRIKRPGQIFSYYLTKHEGRIVENESEITKTNIGKMSSQVTYDERDLHILLSTYLKSVGISSKTIFHERSSNAKDANQKWLHPDMVGISFTKLNSVTQKLLKSINPNDAFSLYSYEIKKDINTDYELKQAFFQTVSNSTWANFSYLCAFEINGNLIEELERLCYSFNIGFIKLNALSFESKIICNAAYKKLDYKTINKMSNVSDDFKKFILMVEKIIAADERYFESSKLELNNFCDPYLNSDSDIIEYCKSKNIPLEIQDIGID